ncbi:MAG: PDDEXK nuclease domain-containing protein [Spirochaetia bacterium]|nr:PDDEXK nuclease domain-containing protein [Spirochaetia bacterium]
MQRGEIGNHELTQIDTNQNPKSVHWCSFVLIRGFFWNFRQFYLTFPQQEILYALHSELSWTHYRILMRVENSSARDYYMNEAAGQNWSSRTLERNINTLYYERLLSTQQKQSALAESKTLEKASPAEFIKDPLVLEFLGLPRPHGYSERRFEDAIISNLQQFLLKLGKGFSFVGRQYRMTTETKNFFIDLVFYNFHLKCFILIDLKIGELTHQDIGQMDMYVRLFEDRVKGQDDNPTVGIILCTEKDETIVKYSVLKEGQQVFASRYKTWLPTEEELRKELERERRLFEERESGDA